MAKRRGFHFTVMVGAVINLLFFNAILEFLGEMFVEIFANIFGGLIGDFLSWLFRQIKRIFGFVIILILWPFRKLFGW